MKKILSILLLTILLISCGSGRDNGGITPEPESEYVEKKFTAELRGYYSRSKSTDDNIKVTLKGDSYIKIEFSDSTNKYTYEGTAYRKKTASVDEIYFKKSNGEYGYITLSFVGIGPAEKDYASIHIYGLTERTLSAYCIRSQV
ncbi:hypothetical protein KRE49_11870 [Elizabethkingia meningoseptica]|uniref:hypothetical protein n=1 Tax=Elizabethkingia meningoseptica TaxID=238 RepID=UPI0023B040D1|nr:hypothetical protein [Elizabethkingia meningoseptica]MDE5516436.1 hypothetical protein [Elizabethkingia meningoseptica]MDN4033706.1 hypothetical protein [Elizabethkingia meningoseptica]